MAGISKILVGIDGSRCAEEATKMAVELAKKYGAAITLLHVHVPPETTRELPAHPKAADAPKKLEGAERIVAEAGLECRSMVEVGIPARTIIDESEKGYDLVILGSRGLGAVEGFLLGSVTSRVSHHIKVPLLIVPCKRA